jgi:hypothetical protein
MFLGDYVVPGHQSVLSASLTTEDCCQSAVHAGLDSRIVILLLPNVVFKSVQIPSDTVAVQILDLAAAISPLVATKPGLTLIANLSETVLPIGNTIAREAMCVLEVFAAVIQDQTTLKTVGNRIDIRSVAVWIIPDGPGETRCIGGTLTCHPERSIKSVNAGIYEETTTKLPIIYPNQIPKPAFDGLSLGRIRECFVRIEGTKHPCLPNKTLMTTLDSLDIEWVRRDLEINHKDLLASCSLVPDFVDATGLAMYTCTPASTAADACSGKKQGGVSRKTASTLLAITPL